jgi:hypothetical protein
MAAPTQRVGKSQRRRDGRSASRFVLAVHARFGETEVLLTPEFARQVMNAKRLAKESEAPASRA